MPQEKDRARNRHLKAIEKSAREIFDKAEAREKAGKEPFHASWQAALETVLLLAKKHLIERPGQLLPTEIDGQKEWEFYLDIQEKLDLPPDTCAVLITPSSFKATPVFQDEEFEHIEPKAWERGAYSIIISDLKDHKIIMQVSLPGAETIGIDVFEEGHHLADYGYNTIEECLDDLTKITWIYFNPEGKWTDELIRRYTENWFAKRVEMDLEDTVIHEKYSYLHHPELLNLTPLESVFRVIGKTIPRKYGSLEEVLEAANDLNRDLDLGDPVITKEGILQDKEPDRRALVDWIGLEIDLCLEELRYLKVVRFTPESTQDPRYKRFFDETVAKVYEVIVGRHGN
jgi:hypothetical protein